MPHRTRLSACGTITPYMNQPVPADNAIREKLHTYTDPYLGQTLGEAKAVAAVTVQSGAVHVELVLGFPCGDYVAELHAALRDHLQPLLGKARLELTLRAQITAHAVQRTLKPLANVKNIVAVASGKGGVGKSTTAANLALAWAAQGAKVGLLDADIYGPSQPLMMGLSGSRPVSPDGKHMTPLRAHGVEVMSIGFMIDQEQPMAWRGPMVTQALTQISPRGVAEHLGQRHHVGRSGLLGGGHAARNRRHPTHAGTAGTRQRSRHCHHPAGYRSLGRPQGAQDVRKGRGTGARGRGEHEPACLFPLRPP